MTDAASDLNFYFDPLCPFAWMTSKWVRRVAALREYRVDWRFISLRLINASVDYAAQFPEGYEQGHTAGLRLLRVAAKVRTDFGRDAVGPLYEAIGRRAFETAPDGSHREPGYPGTRDYLAPILAEVDLPAALADSLEDTALDAQLRTETDEALALTGKDVGTPILQFAPPDGPAFFGPVISRLPHPDEAEELWEHVVALARFPGFSELKRSLRELPQLRALGVAPDEVGVVQDWHGGSRRLKR